MWLPTIAMLRCALLLALLDDAISFFTSCRC